MSSRRLIFRLLELSHGLAFLLILAFLSVQGAAPASRGGSSSRDASGADSRIQEPSWSATQPAQQWRTATARTLCEVDASEVEGDDDRSGLVDPSGLTALQPRLRFCPLARAFVRPEARACTAEGSLSFALARGPPNAVG